ncbi:hypothetical protein [Nocardia sp. NPDC005998]|uniref:hypothetical protein n=1 Tax=Nocardia sp. NPDC005998 TaxID=3156894 RepID=UPI0033B29315
MLHADPKMVIRLDEIEDDLLVRRERAETEGWHGEVERLDLTLLFLRTKRREATRLEQNTVTLGLPVPVAKRAQ